MIPQQTNNPTEAISDKVQTWGDTLTAYLPNILIALVTLILSYFISRYVYKFSSRLLLKKVKQPSVAKLLARLFAIFIVILGLVIALITLNLSESVKGLLAGAGISGLIIGLALQGTLSNSISGILLSFRKKVRQGDWIETNGYSGEIIDINLNYLVLKEADNNIVVIPNKSIIEKPLKNLSLTSKMRVTLNCGVSYDSNLEEVEELTKKTITESFEQVDSKKNVEFFYTSFADSSINFICRFWIDAENTLEKLRAKSKALKEIKVAYDENDITIPFPIRTLQLEMNQK